MPIDPDLLEPFERLVDVSIEGCDFRVPDNNSVLRALQYLDFDLDPCRLCWNSDCDNCHVEFCEAGSEREVCARGCETNVSAGMRILRLPPHAVWPKR